MSGFFWLQGYTSWEAMASQCPPHVRLPKWPTPPPRGESRATLQMTARGVSVTADGAMARGAVGYQPLPRRFLGANRKIRRRVNLTGVCPTDNLVAHPDSDQGSSLQADAVPSTSSSLALPSRRVTRAMSASGVTSTPVSLPGFVCSICGREFQSSRGLLMHSRRMHGGSDPMPVHPRPERSIIEPLTPILPDIDPFIGDQEPVDILPDDALDSSLNCSITANFSTLDIHSPIAPRDGLPISSSPSSSGTVVFLCNVCGRSFSTKTGLGVHQQRAHPIEYQASINFQRKKARWSDEERRLLALKEAELLWAGKDRINDELSRLFQERSWDSIKSQRRSNEHKRLVAEFLANFETQGEIPQALPVSREIFPISSLAKLNPFIEEVGRHLSASSSTYKEGILNDIWRDIGHSSPELIRDRLALYLFDLFPDKVVSRDRHRPVDEVQVESRRRRRQRIYKQTQQLYKKNRTRCIGNLLNPTSISSRLTGSVVVPFWKAVMTDRDPVDSALEWNPIRSQLDCVWEPILLAEIKSAGLRRASAPGPDGLSVDDIDVVPPTVLSKIFNLFLVLGEIPSQFLRARTIFIPKKVDAADPSDLRPISVTSVLLRKFHKILAARLMQHLEFDFRQRGFLPMDGCALNTATFEMLIKHQRSRFKDFFMASLDISRAFDSVSFEAVRTAAMAAGLPPSFVEYLRFTQDNSMSSLSFNDMESEYFHPTRGVRQGDPLSPILFNLVMDYFLRSIPCQIGIDVGATRFAALAYADDILLLASTSAGLQTLLDTFDQFLRQCSLRINIAKSFGLALRSLARERKIIVDQKSSFMVQDYVLPMKGPLDSWSYLGIVFNPHGRAKVSRVELASLMERIRKAPLKPQQRLFALRFFIIPKFQHILTLGYCYMGFLNQLDQQIRQEVRRWVDLPHDAPIAYFHAAIGDGGLGIPALRWTIPVLKIQRFQKLKTEFSHTSVDYIDHEIRRAKLFGQFEGTSIHSSDDIKRMWARRLYAMVDGSLLKDSGKLPSQNTWVGDGTSFLSSKDFINCLKLRINTLPTRSRTTRGRAIDRHCRGGCSRPESLAHVLQVCHRTHEARIRRHDAIANYVAAKLESRGYVVLKEPRISSDLGLRKPDLIAVKDKNLHVIDAQIVSETNLKIAHERKRNHYKNNASFHRNLIARFNTTNITYHTITLNYVGIWSIWSAEDLLTFGLISKADVKIISTRVLVGGYASFRRFCMMTSVRR